MLISAALRQPKIPPKVDSVTVYKARCEARAYLYGASELDLHNAVDELEEFARTLGINHSIGIDGSQAIMAEAFRPVREREWADASAWTPAASSEDAVGIADPIDEIASAPSRTPASTIDALMYALRRGLSCLNEPGNYDRLQRCEETAIRQIAADLMTWPGKTADGKPRPWLPAWTAEEVVQLTDIWGAS